MWTFHMSMQCSGPFLEVSPDEVESAELSIESGVSHVLLARFEEVMMGEVSVFFSPDSRKGLHRYFVQVGAECDHQYSALSFSAGERIEHAIAKDISALLKELFGAVNVDVITMHPLIHD